MRTNLTCDCPNCPEEVTSELREFSNLITSSLEVREIVWLDAHSQGGPEWVSIEEAYSYAREPLPKIKNIGYVLFETEDYVAITDTVGEDTTGTVHSIPRNIIIEMSTLRRGQTNDNEGDR